MSDFKEKVQKVLEEMIDPALRAHGGGIELVGVREEEGVVEVRLIGACHG